MAEGMLVTLVSAIPQTSKIGMTRVVLLSPGLSDQSVTEQVLKGQPTVSTLLLSSLRSSLGRSLLLHLVVRSSRRNKVVGGLSLPRRYYPLHPLVILDVVCTPGGEERNDYMGAFHENY